MTSIAVVVLALILLISVWAWIKAPGRHLPEQLLQMWNVGVWGKQVLIDFYALEAILALWMVSHASVNDAWPVLIPCLVAMPIFGAMPAAAYWLLAVA